MKRSTVFYLLIMLITFGFHTTFANQEKLKLKVYDKQLSEEDLRNLDGAIEEANTCLQTALKFAPFEISLELVSAQALASNYTLPPTDAEYIRRDGSIYSHAGWKTDELEVFISDGDGSATSNGNRGHVLRHPISGSDADLNALEAIAKALFDYDYAVKMAETTRLNTYLRTSRSSSQTSSRSSLQVAESRVKAALERLKAINVFLQFGYGSEIFISRSYVNQTRATGRVLAHEIMHAWGGLADRYHPSFQNEPNLMGMTHECVLNESQIQSIVEYRRSATIETVQIPN